ncbi:hypothetical protein O181_001392 [Austropuccinia psidii MF-1]|uniref:Uncharacterized protein n=1 Tax=Austropuccinia psidii MF-1 TaxID=1389203 RepID=A0A9Q3BAI1_9BASI|nr:hypothetical protein [Austropuccinia psidii MF-1]
MALSSPPPAPSPWAPLLRHTASAYDCFMQEPYRAANCFAPLKSDRSNFAEWLTCLNRVLCVALNTEMLIDNSVSSINNRFPEENRAICHFIDVSIPHKFALCIGVTPSRLTAKDFFDAIKARCCPGNRLEKLQIIREMLGMLVKNGSGAPQPNKVLVLSLCCTFAMFKKLGIKADELEGLLAQAACHTHAAFDQLVTTAILAKGEEKPSSTFVGQVILNASMKTNKNTHQLSPFVYRVADPPTTPTHTHRDHHTLGVR